MAVVLKVRRGEGDCVRTGAEPRAGLWGRQWRLFLWTGPPEIEGQGKLSEGLEGMNPTC